MSQQSSKGINIGLWLVQIIIAALFILPGFMKMLQPIDKLASMMPWTGQVPQFMVRGLGLLDLLGGLGIILPSLMRIKPKLTVTAAYASILLMISAIIFHVSRGESSVIGFNFVLIALLAFVAWGRSIKAPILSR